VKRSSIQFGTDGWRALVAEEFTFPNVRAVTQAIAEHLKANPPRGRLPAVIVGFDTRPFGDRFAEAAAEVLAGNGLHVFLSQGPMPTPAISFHIREMRLCAGVLITASHNPFTYNGVKFRPFYAGSAEAEVTRSIEKRLFRHGAKKIPLEKGLASGQIRRVDLRPRYVRFLRKYVDGKLLKKARFRVAYDAMHGAGQDLFLQAADGSALKILPVPGSSSPVPSSYRPEPTGEHLKELSSFVRQERCDIGLATDGDADRAGIVGPEGEFLSSQETMALLLWHLLEDRGWRGLVVTTVAGTNLIETIASRYKVPVARTPVGFKHIVRFIRTRDVLFGAEESGGFAFRGFVPERDGILAGLLLLEMMAARKRELPPLRKELHSHFGRWIYSRTDLKLERPMDPGLLQRWVRGRCRPHRKGGSTRPLANSPGRGTRDTGVLFEDCATPVKKIQTLDGAKVILEDGSWLLMRPSGTEPLLRVYAEAKNLGTLQALLKAGERIGLTLMGR